jgi:type IV secretion system protein TrbF
MRTVFRRRAAAPGAPAPAAEAAENPLLAGRSAFYGAFADLARGKRNWQLFAYALLALDFVTLGAYLRLSFEARITPYIVEVDRLGHPLAFGPADRIARPDARVLVWTLAEIVRDLRTVYPDPAAQKDLLYRAYAHLTGSALGFLDAYYARPDNDPRLLGRSVLRHVDVTSVLQIPDSPTWKVEWTEREEPVFSGIPRTASWEAYLTVRVVPPRTTRFIEENPLGIYVSALTWTQIAQAPEKGTKP